LEKCKEGKKLFCQDRDRKGKKKKKDPGPAANQNGAEEKKKKPFSHSRVNGRKKPPKWVPQRKEGGRGERVSDSRRF